MAILVQHQSEQNTIQNTLVYIILHGTATECKFIADDTHNRNTNRQIIKWKQKRKHRMNNVNEHNLFMTLYTSLRYASQKIQSKASNSKLDIEKLTPRHQNKIWTNLQIKNHTKSQQLRMIGTQTQHKNPEHMHLNFLTLLTPPVEKIVHFKWIK